MVKLSLKKKKSILENKISFGGVYSLLIAFQCIQKQQGRKRHTISDIFCCFQIAIFSFHLCYPSLHPQVAFRSLFPLPLSLVPLGMDF